jgi:DNA-binding IclR family transcriptional regulator
MSQPNASEAAPAIQSVERAARMLGLFTIEEPRLTLGDLTRRMEMSKATVHRYATALRNAGLLRLTAGAYTLGPRIVELASAALAGLAVVNVAGPYMERLVGETEETAVLSVWDGEAPVVVRVEDNTSRLVRIVVATGSRLPSDSAQGQVFRAFIEPPGTDPELDRIRATGTAHYAAVVDGIAALAAPVFQGEDVIATIALVGTTASVQTSGRSEMARALRDAAGNLSTELGFVGTRGVNHEGSQMG